jgi:signal peptidase I
MNRDYKPAFAFLLSLVSPGLGQFYNGSLKRAIFIQLSLCSFLFIISPAQLLAHFPGFVLFYSVIFFACILSAFDAFRQAKLPETRPGWDFSIVFFLVFVILSGFLARSSRYHAYDMSSGSMKPTLSIGDKVMADLKAYEKGSMKRGDVIICFTPPSWENNHGIHTKEVILKRIVALGGDEVQIKDKLLYVNGQPIVEPYVLIQSTITYPAPRQRKNYQQAWEETRFLKPWPIEDARDNFGPIRIPNGSCLVLGDNRDASFDSRFFGPIPVNDINGKALYIYWSKSIPGIGKELSNPLSEQ